MAKYRVTYADAPTQPVDVDQPELKLVNKVPNPVPVGNWTVYYHADRMVLRIETADRDAALLIVAPSGAVPGTQRVKAELGLASGEATQWKWTSSANALRLDLAGDASDTDFDLTDSHQPPQSLRVVVRRVATMPQ